MTAYTFRKKSRFGVTFFLFFLLMLQIASISRAGNSDAAEIDCKQLLSQASIAKMDNTKMKKIQKDLKDIDYDPIEIDGILGDHTKSALRQFCIDFTDHFKKDSPDDFIAAISLYATIAQKFPESKKIVLNDDFDFWIYQQPADKRAESLLIMRSGTAEEIIALLKKYKSDRKKITKKNPLDKFERSDRYVVSYKWTESDPEKLSDRDDIVSKIEKLQDERFSGKDKLWKALQKAVAPQTDEVDQYQDLIIHLARAQDTYTLTKTSLNDLKKENLPDTVHEDLQKLQVTEYPNQNEFVTALQPVIEKVRNEFKQYQPLIINAAKEPRTYTLTEESLKILDEKGLPNDLLDKLDKFKNITFKDKAQFISKVQPVIEDITIEYNFPKGILPRFSDLQTGGLIVQREEAEKIIKDVTDEYHKYQEYILEQVQPLPGYRVTDQTIKKLKAKGVPDFIINVLKSLKSEDFLDEDQFKIALNAKIVALIKNYQLQIEKHVEKLETYQLTELALNKLRQELKTKEIPGAIIKMLRNDLLDVEYANEYLFIKALRAKIDYLYLSLILQHAETVEGPKKKKKFKLTEAALEKVTEELDEKKLPVGIEICLQDLVKEPYMSEVKFKTALYERIKTFTNESVDFDHKIAKIARKEHPIDVKPDTIKWIGGNCGCVLDELSKKGRYRVVVYGFYPFWMSENEVSDLKNDKSEEAKVPQQLDFSVYSRIGYYALPVGNRGYLKQEKAWNINKKAGFIKTAEKYRTKVDLVIYKKDWENWSKTKDIEKYTSDLVQLIGTVADGITINFDGYPFDPNSKKNFSKFINKLKIKLLKTGKGLNLNLMLPRDAIGVDIFNYENLEDILISEKMNENVKVNLLVFLDEPTTLSKKALRADIEKNYSGEARMKILRKIVPIITYDGHNTKQLYDDALYCKENFGGIGFWPLQIGDSKNAVNIAADISGTVRKVFSVQYEDMGAVKKGISWVCNFICPNRWLFRISWVILVVVLPCFVLLYLGSCKFRNFFKGSRIFYWIIMLVLFLFIAISLLLLYCDPRYLTWREGNVPLVIAIAFVIGLTVWQNINKMRLKRNP